MKNAQLCLLFLMFLLLGIVACHKDCDNRLWDEGVITGPDYRECACCGGWFITIDRETWRAQSFPGNFAATLSEDDYPVPVRLIWEKDPTPCLGDEIEVPAIRRR